jgi:formylglycine-generating enzyme required for sulfatase activity
MRDFVVCLVRKDGVPFCIDQYEASHSDATFTHEGASTKPISFPGVLPWNNISWMGALTACQAAKKRLCEGDEWIQACQGDKGTTYTYGNVRTSTTCNVSAFGHPVATGTIASCHSTIAGSAGTYDQSGNVAEWTGNTVDTASARGGSYRSSQTHACTDESIAIAPTTVSDEIGFRCCENRN